MPIVQTSLKSKNYNALGIDEIADDIENIITEVNILSAGGGSGTTTTVNITSAQILAMGATPVGLLPAPGVGMYYDIERVILEYTHVTTAYTLADFIAIYGNQTTYGLIYDSLISTAESMVYTFSPIGASDNTGAGYAEKLNKSVVLSTVTGADPTDGDGTLKAIITYTVRTFGA